MSYFARISAIPHNPQEPVVNLEGYAELFVQSLSMDLADLFEEPEAVQYPSDRRQRTSSGTVVGMVDKEALLAELDQRMEQHPGMTEAEAFETAIEVAHGENLSEWVGALGQVLDEQAGAQTLLGLQEQSGLPWVKVWLAVRDIEWRSGGSFISGRPLGVGRSRRRPHDSF